MNWNNQLNIIYKFDTGRSYIGKLENENMWYVIQQKGMKTWVATCFSHVISTYDQHLASFTGNGKLLRANFEWEEVYSFMSDAAFRHAMFNVLKYGQINKKD